MKKILLFSLLVLGSFTLLAQKGVVKGNIVDAASGEELIGVTVVIQGTTNGAVTDFSGNYFLELDPGTYTLQYSYISFQTQVIQGVEVTAGGVKVIDILMQEDNIQLEEVVVQAEAINNNEVAMLKLQKKAYAVQDGISAAEIGRLGASNSAESMKQVTGATIENGKYVVMRGLGDRYSITQMNGVPLPSTDPYRNSSSMDLIPTSMVENIVTKKTFTPDQPGNFTGGNVDITTKPLPDQFYLQVGAQVGFNTQSSFNDEFLADPVNGGNDFWGFDDGARELDPYLADPANFEALKNSNLFFEASLPSEPDATRDLFNTSSRILNQPVYEPVQKTAGLNTKFTIGFGDRKPLFNGKFGYNVGLTFNRNFTHLEDRQANRWEYFSNPGATELGTIIRLRGNQSIEATTLSGLFGVAYQFNDFNELSASLIYNHDGEFNTLDMDGFWPAAISGGHTYEDRRIQFTDRTLENLRLSGKHVIRAWNNLEIEWTGVRINSTQDRPDIRYFRNDIQGDPPVYRLSAAEYDLPFRLWRELEDIQYTGKLDITIPLTGSNKVKVGGFYTTTDRDFAEIRYQMRTTGTVDGEQPPNPYIPFSQTDGDFSGFFSPSNAGQFDVLRPPSNARFYTGNWYQNTTLLQNEYVGQQTIFAGYAMLIQNITEKLKFVGGLRIESTEQETITPSQDAQGNPTEIIGQIDELDFLPSINLIYALNDQSNLRASFSQTLARPNLREMAPFTSPGETSGFQFTGNPDLTKTEVVNLDLRYEVFQKPGELFAISGFYKKFTNPIQTKLTTVGSGIDITWINTDEATLLGAEFEYRKGLEFISPALEKFSLGTNFTYTFSSVDLDSAEFARGSNVNPDLEDTRPFQAQSPFIWNLNLTYLDFESGIESAISMNMFGRRLTANGNAGTPDLYEINGKGNSPVPTINFTFAKTWGENWTGTFKAINILNVNTETNQEFNNQYFVNNRFQSGITFSLGVRYSIN